MALKMGLQSIQQVSGLSVSSILDRDVSSSQMYKYVRIRQLEYPMQIASISDTDTEYSWILKNSCNIQ
jgi:hypothetical protein